MIRLVRTETLRRLHASAAEGAGAIAEAEQQRQEAALATDSAARAEVAAENLLRDLDRAHADRVQAERERDEQFNGLHAVIKQVTAERDAARTELEAARAQVLLDAEDRVALRMLLRSARKQERRTDRVYVLFRSGELHSVHATVEAAEEAAEAEGAPRDGWTSLRPGAALPPAAEMAWRVQALPLGGAQ